MKKNGNLTVLFVLFFSLQFCLFFQPELWGADPAAKPVNSVLQWEECAGSFPVFFQQLKQKDFLAQSTENPWPFLFSWTSSSHAEARYPAYQNSPFITLMGIRVYEIICRFSQKDSLLDSIYFSVYNRGDTGTVPGKEEFQRILLHLDKGITQIAGTAGELQTEQVAKMPVSRKVWFDSQKYLTYVLLWSYAENSKKFVPEFIQLDVMRFDPTRDPRKRPLDGLLITEKPKAKTLIQNVSRNAGGDIWIQNIPMVDQGAKGYCAAAVAERVLRYFGVQDVNQHRIAQWLGTDARNGTSDAQMIAAFRKIGSNYGVRLNQEYTRFRSLGDLEKLLKKYNREAKKYKQEQAKLIAQGRAVDVNATLLSMHPGILFQVMGDNSLAQKSFIKSIQGSVEKGIPMVWCVTLGLLPEKNLSPENRGGHMRLIIGINPKRKEIIYSDTWGIHHEIKVMPYADAFMITNSLYRLEPRKK